MGDARSIILRGLRRCGWVDRSDAKGDPGVHVTRLPNRVWTMDLNDVQEDWIFISISDNSAP